ncbi:MAG TPA: nuclear transport factor 2 family protein [Candidatus Angelobacter sp.]
MRFLLTLMAVAVFAGCAGEPKHPTWTNATGAEHAERLMWQSIQSKDWASVERHLSPTFLGVMANGRTLDRAGWVEQWQSAQVREFSMGEVQVYPEGADMKITYIFHVQASTPGPESPEGFRVMSVWQDVKSRWMLSAISITAIQNHE